MRTLSLLSLLALGACDPSSSPSSTEPVGTIDTTGAEVIGTIEGQPFTQEMLDTLTERIPPQQLEMMKASGRFQEFLDRIAVGQALYQKALAEGLADDPDVRLSIAMATRDVLASEMVDRMAEDAVTDEKLQEAYEAKAVQYKRPQVKARHLLVKDEAKAQDLKKQLDDGADFEALVSEHSEDEGSKENGGDLGWFSKARMLPEISEAAFSAEKGAVLGPIKTRMGYHLIRVDDLRDATPFEEVKEELAEQVKQETVTQEIEKLQSEVKATWTLEGHVAANEEGSDEKPEAH